MNRKIIKIVAIYAFVISAGAVYPFVFLTDDQLQVSLDIVRTLSILATSIFALLYFDPLGIKKKNIEKQYENVVKILEQFIGRSISFSCEWKENGITTKMILFNATLTKENVFKYFNKDVSDPYTEVKNCLITFEMNDLVESQRKLIKLKNHLWTPKEISRKLSFLEFQTGVWHNEFERVQTAKIHFSHKQAPELTFFHKLNGKTYTVSEFLFRYKELIVACENWLEINSFSKNSLNI